MQYTLRGIPSTLDKALRKKATVEGRSLNQVILDALTRGAGLDQPVKENHDLDFAIGTWVEDPVFDEIIAEQRKIDPELWQ